ncbi:M56 family metallopeptidase [Isoptericola sp. 178]|uniref:M56 family metallopeptidase n=1 Tax=Isoptericola sp. 178 TaxID=3064651 RepID=UPI002712D75C|nr:M56 family metallopeptidase [Isoptericola sp. 178]MDO8145435.1 M56 family metallopeptidase [Isoptericola sp. 178]
MTTAVAALAGLGIVLAALSGPWLVRRAAPALVRAPLTAAVVLTGGVLLWLAAVLAVGPMLAWTLSGPAVLPGAAGDVCRRCLAAADPFAGTPLDTAVPVVLLLAVPAVVAGVLATVLGRDLLRRRRETARTAAVLRSTGAPRVVGGHRVLVVPDDAAAAFALPARHGGVVVTTGALEALEDTGLAAVLAHEDAHLRQRHHLVAAVVEALATHLRWIPVVAAVADAVPTYLEIAADDVARHRVGTTALAGALLTLGDAPDRAPVAVGALHAGGPDRIRHLVAPGTASAGTWPAVAVGAHLGVLAAVALAVHVPYAGALLSGCA